MVAFGDVEDGSPDDARFQLAPEFDDQDRNNGKDAWMAPNTRQGRVGAKVLGGPTKDSE